MASTIYKINLLDNTNKISNIYVFLGFNATKDELDNLNDDDKFKSTLADDKSKFKDSNLTKLNAIRV
jgi:hypothetical protein